MKKILLILFVCNLHILNGQNPIIIKAVGSSILEPKNKDSEIWQNNEWNGKFFYQGTGANCKLCVTDGTTAGTIYLKDLNADLFQYIIPAQNFIYIITEKTTGTYPSLAMNMEIWKSDGTAAGTVMVKAMPTFNPFSSSSYNTWTSDANLDRNYSVDGDVMYFGGYDATNGNELWRTDGTSAGTYIIKDIKSGTGNSNVGGFCKIGNTTLFRAAASGLNYTLWKTDGTALGTEEIPVPGLTFWQAPVGKINNKLIFYGYDAVNGAEPWVSDGTSAGTYMLADITPGSSNSTTSSLQNLHFRFNGKYCFFIANNPSGQNLWRTDGNSGGTIQLTTEGGLYSNYSGGGYSDIDSTGLWWLDGNTTLYKSDGTVAGTSKVTTTLSNALYLKIYKKAAWFHARRASIYNAEPWRSDGTGVNTKLALNIQAGDLESYPYGFFVTNNKLHFFTKSVSQNLYQYNGDFTFNGSVAGGNWRDSLNWNSLIVPGITDSVFINAGTLNSLNLNGANAYAGTIIMQNNAIMNIGNAGDSLIINNKLVTGSNNSFTGNGIVALRNSKGDTVQISEGFTANNLALLSNTNLINGNLNIGNNLNLANSSKLIINNNNVTLTGNTSTATANATSYIVTNGIGKMLIENIGSGGRTGTETFPIGTSTNYNPVTFLNSGTADAFGARVVQGININYGGETPQGSTYISGGVNNTWFITENNAGGSNANIGLQWNASQELPSFDRNIAQLGHYTGGMWDLGAAGSASGVNPYTFSRSGITSFSPFGILNNNAVLPILFAKLKVVKTSTGNNLQWHIEATDALMIDLEKSDDARHFTKFYQTAFKDKGFYTDISINGKAYYRLKITDKDDKITYSNIVSVEGKVDNIKVYPTVTPSVFTVQNNSVEDLEILLFSNDGKLIKKQHLQMSDNILNLDFYSKGTYHYILFNGSIKQQSGIIIKQ